jgi:NAD(P)H-dependent flavin oxidoreductase YrpB (nitropropane dioxygenase family)
MMETAFTRLVGCSVPLQQAGFAGAATPELAGAVAHAGGLGMVGMSAVPPNEVAATLAALNRVRPGRVGMNFLVPFLDEAVVEAAAPNVRAVEFFYGDPEVRLVERVHSAGALADWQVGSVDEAKAAEQAGCDFIVAQGIEAGGHIRGRIGLLALLDEVLDGVKVPVLAAGGIGSARTMAAVLAAGAAGVRVGTRFVATKESAAHPGYIDALVAASAADTVYTTAFSVGWPDAPHRSLRSAVAAMEAFDGEVVGETVVGPKRIPIPRGAAFSPTSHASGMIDAMALHAGESVGKVTRVESAGEVVRELAGGAEALLRVWGDQSRGF